MKLDPLLIERIDAMNTMYDGFGDNPPEADPKPEVGTLDCYGGVDPGKDGWIAAISSTGAEVLWAERIPTVKIGSKKEYDLPALYEIAKRFKGKRVYLEEQDSSPQQGSKSAFTTGYGWGLVRMAFVAAGASVVIVKPAKWKKTMGLTLGAKVKKGMNKNQQTNALKAKARLAAQDRFPDYDFRVSSRGKVASADKAEAVLIAVYGRMCHVGAA